MSAHPIGPYPPPSYPLSPRPSTDRPTPTATADTASTHPAAPAPDLAATGPGGGLLILGVVLLAVGIVLFVLLRRGRRRP